MSTLSIHKGSDLMDEQIIEMYRYMLMTRKVDEHLWLLNRAGKIPFMVSSQGHEGVSVPAAMALDREKDWLCPYYRDLGMVLYFGQTIKEQMLAAFAKKEDPNSGGRQMPCHYGDRRYRILSGSSPVATQFLHAVGIAYASKLQKKDLVVFASCGEGSSNQGDFHEACNFAGIHKLPVIFMVENNQYAISVPLSKQIAGGSIANRAQAYGFPGVRVDGSDPIAVYQVVREAVQRARSGEGPTLIEGICHRLTPHSTDDDDRKYRSQEEREEAQTKDPVRLFRQYLMDVNLLDEEQEAEFSRMIDQEIEEAVAYMDQAVDPEASELYQHVYA